MDILRPRPSTRNQRNLENGGFTLKTRQMFSVLTLKRKAGIFKFLRFEERFPKAPLSWRISVDGRPNRRNKAAISNSFRVVDRNWDDLSHHWWVWSRKRSIRRSKVKSFNKIVCFWLLFVGRVLPHSFYGNWFWFQNSATRRPCNLYTVVFLWRREWWTNWKNYETRI